MAEAQFTIGGVGKASYLQFSFPNIILEAIRYPEMYAKLNLLIIRNLDSKHSIALYENLKDYQNVGGITIDIHHFRKLMGIEDGKYTNFTMLKKRIIDIAVVEVNKKTDIRVAYNLGKVGRKVTSIQFSVKHQQNSSINCSENILLEDKLISFGFKEHQVKKLLKQHQSDYLWENIKTVEQDIYS